MVAWRSMELDLQSRRAKEEGWSGGAAKRPPEPQAVVGPAAAVGIRSLGSGLSAGPWVVPGLRLDAGGGEELADLRGMLEGV